MPAQVMPKHRLSLCISAELHHISAVSLLQKFKMVLNDFVVYYSFLFYQTLLGTLASKKALIVRSWHPKNQDGIEDYS